MGIIDLYLLETKIKVYTGFNGADVHAMDRISQNFKPEKLPLSICYRCPKNVVKLAQSIVPDITWNEKKRR